MALLESNFENRLSFVEESCFFLYNHVFCSETALLKKVAPKWISIES